MSRKKTGKKIPVEILSRIEEARESRSHVLDLSRLNEVVVLDSIPEEVFELVFLEELNLNRIGISTIPSEIVQLSNLRRLNVSNNKIKTLPVFLNQLSYLNTFYFGGNSLEQIPGWITDRKDWIGLGLSRLFLQKVPDWLSYQLNLEYLNLSSNMLDEIPDWISRLDKLQSLDLSMNPIHVIPKPIYQLRSLVSLNLEECNLSEIPEMITSLAQLEHLDLSSNFLFTLPDSLTKLKNLKFLNLGDNRFKEIPHIVYELSSLEHLLFLNINWLISGSNKNNSNRNTISEVPTEITQLINLKYLMMQGNPIQTPPEEIVKRGIDAIREYYRQTEEQGTDELFEAKLLLVGEPGAGKTSLANKIQDSDYVLQPQQESTKGIDIAPWQFSIHGKEFRVNLWDFGGQEIYHATHQYFLTKRSLYLLVADTRQEDTDFEFWLNVIELLSGDSPVLIIKNEKQERQRELDERMLRGRFRNLKEILATNLETNRGLERIRDTIQYHLRHLPHIGTPLPKNWVKVRAVLENDPHSTLSLEEYLHICAQNGFDRRDDALQLSGYLHDLGVCLHFQDDPLLRHLVILKTQWGTDAAYKVLDNPTVINNLGLFTRGDLQKIWDHPEYLGMHDELLQLMMKFRLCYRIPGTAERYMAPQLLSLNCPDYSWNENENLYMRYTYEFMPKGLLTQLIVALHEQIANHNLVWRNGVVLDDERGQARAEVIEYYQKREIQIRVSGVQKRELLTIITHELGKIHRSYSGLKYDALIPCNCDKCREKTAPHFYRLDTLKYYIQHQRQAIECQVSFQAVGIRGLIDDVITPLINAHHGSYMEIGGQRIEAENLFIYTGPVDQRQIDTDGGAFIGGIANVGGIVVGRDQIQITFSQVYEAIEKSPGIQSDDKPQVLQAVKDIEDELRDGGEEPSEGFLKRRFRNIAAMAPDIVDVAVAAAANPVAGFTEAARKIAKRAAEQAKVEAENNRK